MIFLVTEVKHPDGRKAAWTVANWETRANGFKRDLRPARDILAAAMAKGFEVHHNFDQAMYMRGSVTQAKIMRRVVDRIWALAAAEFADRKTDSFTTDVYAVNDGKKEK